MHSGGQPYRLMATIRSLERMSFTVDDAFEKKAVSFVIAPLKTTLSQIIFTFANETGNEFYCGCTISRVSTDRDKPYNMFTLLMDVEDKPHT